MPKSKEYVSSDDDSSEEVLFSNIYINFCNLIILFYAYIIPFIGSKVKKEAKEGKR